jgi:hypothetical protein
VVVGLLEMRATGAALASNHLAGLFVYAQRLSIFASKFPNPINQKATFALAESAPK